MVNAKAKGTQRKDHDLHTIELLEAKTAHKENVAKMRGQGKEFQQEVTEDAAELIEGEELVDQFLQGYPADQRQYWRDYLIKKSRDYTKNAKRKDSIFNLDIKEETFASYTRRAHTEKMQIRNSDAFKIIISKLEGVKPDRSDSKIQNLKISQILKV